MSELNNILDDCIECRKCVKECGFLQRHCGSPKELAESFKAGKHRTNPAIPYSCNICSLCEARCPEGLNAGRMCFEMRLQLAQEGLAPLKQHKPIQEAQDWYVSDEFKLVLPAEDAAETKRVFFPGCSLSAYSPDLVLKTYHYISQRLPGTGILLGCCGAPALLIGDQSRFSEIINAIDSDIKEIGASEIIAACPYCYQALKQNIPHLKTRSLYVVLSEIGLPEILNSQRHTFSIHDPCSTRFESEIQNSIRKLIEASGHRIEELEHSRDSTNCCGLGGMAFALDPDSSHKKALITVGEAKSDLVTYCASCRGNLAGQGAQVLHILDLIFNENWPEIGLNPSAEPSAAQENQRNLRQLLQARS
ncbi:MAG: (Fe-S)-binding protein [Methanothrix sp.]|nr:(Fe-S)-binding protein [Methanothrix sp.]